MVQAEGATGPQGFISAHFKGQMTACHSAADALISLRDCRNSMMPGIGFGCVYNTCCPKRVFAGALSPPSSFARPASAPNLGEAGRAWLAAHTLPTSLSDRASARAVHIWFSHGFSLALQKLLWGLAEVASTTVCTRSPACLTGVRPYRGTSRFAAEVHAVY